MTFVGLPIIAAPVQFEPLALAPVELGAVVVGVEVILLRSVPSKCLLIGSCCCCNMFCGSDIC